MNSAFLSGPPWPVGAGGTAARPVRPGHDPPAIDGEGGGRRAGARRRVRVLRDGRPEPLRVVAGASNGRVTGVQPSSGARPPLDTPVIVDEPAGNFDSQRSAEIMGLLRRLDAERGITVPIATQEPDRTDYARRTVRNSMVASDSRGAAASPAAPRHGEATA